MTTAQQSRKLQQSRLPYRVRSVDADTAGWARAAQAELAGHRGGAFLLVRRAGVPQAEIVVDDAAATTAEELEALAAVAGVPAVDRADAATPAAPARPTATVAICTAGRADGLARCLASLARQSDPDFDVLVVDNSPEVGPAVAAAIETADPALRVRLVHEPRRGLSRARNAALDAIGTDLVLCIDDDEEADPGWVAAVRSVFADDPGTDAVSGRVLAARLETEADLLFEEFGGHNKGRGARAARFTKAELGAAIFYPLPPFGVGANMAFRRRVFDRVPRFDPCLGAGSACAGAEDTLFFTELLDAGGVLRYEPSAVTWHHHRADASALAVQLASYGHGLGAFYLALVLRRPVRLLAVLRLVPRAVRDQVRADSARNVGASARLTHLRRGNRLAILVGAGRYLRARLSLRGSR